MIPSPPLRPSSVVIVSGSYGAGHDAAADALAAQFVAAGHPVRRLDVADELPWHVGAALRWAYFTQLRVAPSSWGTTLRGLERDAWPFRVVQRLLGALGRRLVASVAGADLVVSTHPFASQALGEARRRGDLEIPVVTYLTDASVHRLWVHRWVDLHLSMHELSAAEAMRLGARTRVVRPVVPPVDVPPEPGWAAPWPENRPVALVVGGSCGVGDLYATTLDLLATGIVTPVVACGNNTRLREQVARLPGAIALGWRSDLRALIAEASCVVQNAGGMTSLESLAAGTPTITYRPIPGHGSTNAANLSAAGLVPWVQDARELEATLVRVLTAPESFGLPTESESVDEGLRAEGLLSGSPRPSEVAA